LLTKGFKNVRKQTRLAASPVVPAEPARASVLTDAAGGTGGRMAVADLAFWTAADPGRVWRYFTSAAGLSTWHGKAEYFEARPGGRVRFCDPGWDPVEGVVTRVEPGRLLSWRIPADASEITETFDPDRGGTRVTIVQRGTETGWPPDGLPGRIRGWEESVADLVLLLDHGVRAARHLARRAETGMQARDVPAGLAVSAVSPDGPAAAAGLRIGDIVTCVGTAPVYRRTDLGILLRAHQPGETLTIGYVRDRAAHTTQLTLEAPRS
jgi:uncharacterized protein YndB with AHSA1/START domain